MELSRRNRGVSGLAAPPNNAAGPAVANCNAAVAPVAGAPAVDGGASSSNDSTVA